MSVVLLGFFLRAHRIGEQRVWWDEGWSVWVARFPAAEILRQTGHDVHPPLYFELLHLWRLLSGDGEAGLRFLSALFGTLTIAMTFALGRRMARGSLSPRNATLAGFLAAIFLAVSRLAIAWSQEIRMYALASFLAVLAVWAARQVWDRGTLRACILFVLATAAGMYTLYLFAPVWIAVNIAALWVWRHSHNRRRTALQWMSLQLIVAALVIPWLWYASGGFLQTATATPISLIDFLHIFWTTLTVGIPVDVAQFNRLTLPALGIFIVAVSALVVQIARHNRGADGRETWQAARDLALLLIVLSLPAAIVFFVSLPKQNFYNPPFNPRYLVIFTPFYSILLAWGLITIEEQLARRLSRADKSVAAGRALALGLATIMLAVSLVGLRLYYPGRVLIDDYPSLVSTIEAYRRSGDGVILYSDTDWPIFAYHYPESWSGVPHLWAITPQAADGFLQPIWDAHDAVWLVTTPYSANSDPQRTIPAWLDERAVIVREFTYKDMALTLYAKSEARAALADTPIDDRPLHPLEIALPGGGQLTGYGQKAHDFKSGDVIHLFLYRKAGEEIITQAGLIDEAGNPWGAKEIVLGEDVTRWQIDLVVPPEAPSGSYRFFILGAENKPDPFGNLSVTQKQGASLSLDDVVIPNRTDILFAGNIRLLGYDVASSAAQPGEIVELTLFWTSNGNIAQSYKVFTHLLGDVYNADSGNFLWGQVDNEPVANSRPTTTWRANEVIVDQYAIPLAENSPPGTYRIEIGMYNAANGERLSIIGPDALPVADHIILTTVEVK